MSSGTLDCCVYLNVPQMAQRERGPQVELVHDIQEHDRYNQLDRAEVNDCIK